MNCVGEKREGDETVTKTPPPRSSGASKAIEATGASSWTKVAASTGASEPPLVTERRIAPPIRTTTAMMIHCLRESFFMSVILPLPNPNALFWR